MFAALAVVALASTVAVNAAPVKRSSQPTNWASGYLEEYDTYHSRYLALDCQDQHNTTFFDQCCHPLLATESLASRPLKCSPTAAQSESASAYALTATASDSAATEAATEFSEATASVESVYSSLTSASPTATVATTAFYTTATSTDDDATTTSTSSADALATALSANNNWSPATSSTTQPAAATTTASSGGSGNVETGGFATFFYQGGNPGACGQYHSDSEYGIAIDSNGWWQNYNDGASSSVCGKQIQITNTNNGKTVTATVWDVCPTCTSDNSLDLSVGAFTAIASEADGMVPITWQWA